MDRPRKVLYNSWEATGFDVDAAGQLELAKIAAELGAELFVVDDGWFTGRHDDTGGLGDWDAGPGRRSPTDSTTSSTRSGRSAWTSACGSNPRAVSPRSRLYAEHPEWVYRIDGRPVTLVRNQLLLDLGRAGRPGLRHRHPRPAALLATPSAT